MVHQLWGLRSESQKSFAEQSHLFFWNMLDAANDSEHLNPEFTNNRTDLLYKPNPGVTVGLSDMNIILLLLCLLAINPFKLSVWENGRNSCADQYCVHMNKSNLAQKQEINKPSSAPLSSPFPWLLLCFLSRTGKDTRETWDVPSGPRFVCQLHSAPPTLISLSFSLLVSAVPPSSVST